MRRTALVFLTASLLVHGAIGGGGVWLARRAKQKEAAEPKPVFVGETFDIEPLGAERREASDRGARGAQPLEREGPAQAPAPTPRRVQSGAPGIEAPLTYGALGDRSAASVIVALSRAFPQAASTDPIWRTVAFGDAGTAIMQVDLEEDGTLARWSLGPGASPALREAMVRTMAFIGSRTFLARGRVTKLRLAARVSADAVRDGSDAVYALHSEHEGGHASAFFSLSSGRRVDLEITETK